MPAPVVLALCLMPTSVEVARAQALNGDLAPPPVFSCEPPPLEHPNWIAWYLVGKDHVVFSPGWRRHGALHILAHELRHRWEDRFDADEGECGSTRTALRVAVAQRDWAGTLFELRYALAEGCPLAAGPRGVATDQDAGAGGARGQERRFNVEALRAL